MVDLEALVFAEWERRYREEPSRFFSESQRVSTDVSDYGTRCAAYFRRLKAEWEKHGRFLSAAESHRR